jgi:hypothetical protein
VADDSDRLAGFEEAADEFQRLRFGPQLVRVGDSAREDEPIVFARVGLADRPLGVEDVALVEVVEGLDLPRFGRQQLGFGPRLADGLERLGELDLLDPLVRHQKGDFLVMQLVRHALPLPFSAVVSLTHRLPLLRGAENGSASAQD